MLGPVPCAAHTFTGWLKEIGQTALARRIGLREGWGTNLWGWTPQQRGQARAEIYARLDVNVFQIERATQHPGQPYPSPTGDLGEGRTHEDSTMPKIEEMFPSKYLKAADCEDDLILTIKRVTEEKIGQDEKYVIYFKEHEKGLVLNKVNTNQIAKLYGDDTDDWIGKTITLWATETQFQGDMVDCIRVRGKVPKKNTNGKAGKAPAPAAVTDDSDDDGSEDTPF